MLLGSTTSPRQRMEARERLPHLDPHGRLYDRVRPSLPAARALALGPQLRARTRRQRTPARDARVAAALDRSRRDRRRHRGNPRPDRGRTSRPDHRGAGARPRPAARGAPCPHRRVPSGGARGCRLRRRDAPRARTTRRRPPRALRDGGPGCATHPERALRTPRPQEPARHLHVGADRAGSRRRLRARRWLLLGPQEQGGTSPAEPPRASRLPVPEHQLPPPTAGRLRRTPRRLCGSSPLGRDPVP